MYREWKKMEFPKEYYIWIWEKQDWEVDQEIDGKMRWERMEEQLVEKGGRIKYIIERKGRSSWERQGIVEFCTCQRNELMNESPPPKKNRAVYETKKSIVEPLWPQRALQRKRVACWICKATITHLVYVMLFAFALQQWLHEHAPMLRLYVHCGSCHVIDNIQYCGSELFTNF